MLKKNKSNKVLSTAEKRKKMNLTRKYLLQFKRTVMEGTTGPRGRGIAIPNGQN